MRQFQTEGIMFLGCSSIVFISQVSPAKRFLMHMHTCIPAQKHSFAVDFCFLLVLLPEFMKTFVSASDCLLSL